MLTLYTSGMPIKHKNISYNCRIIAFNKKILLIRPWVFLSQEFLDSWDMFWGSWAPGTPRIYTHGDYADSSILASSHLPMTATTAKCVISRHGKHSRLMLKKLVSSDECLTCLLGKRLSWWKSTTCLKLLPKSMVKAKSWLEMLSSARSTHVLVVRPARNFSVTAPTDSLLPELNYSYALRN